MMKLAATAIAAVILQASPTFAGPGEDRVKDLPLVEVLTSIDDRPHRNLGQPSLSSADISAIQYRETDPRLSRLTLPRSEQPN